MRPRNAWHLLGASGALYAALMLLSIDGCSSSTAAKPADGGADRGAPDSATDQGPVVDAGFDGGACPGIAQVSFSGPTCGACAAERCCPSATVCYTVTTDTGVSPCSSLANCIAMCNGSEGDAGDPAMMTTCEGACNTQFSAGKSSYDNLTDCITSACQNDGGTGPCN